MYHVTGCFVSKDSSTEHYCFLVRLIWSKRLVVVLSQIFLEINSYTDIYEGRTESHEQQFFVK